MSAPLDKADAIAFRILGLDERAALRSGLDFRDADAMVAEVIWLPLTTKQGLLTLVQPFLPLEVPGGRPRILE